jgi:hypothetical protein
MNIDVSPITRQTPMVKGLMHGPKLKAYELGLSGLSI